VCVCVVSVGGTIRRCIACSSSISPFRLARALAFSALKRTYLCETMATARGGADEEGRGEGGRRTGDARTLPAPADGRILPHFSPAPPPPPLSTSEPATTLCVCLGAPAPSTGLGGGECGGRRAGADGGDRIAAAPVGGLVMALIRVSWGLRLMRSCGALNRCESRARIRGKPEQPAPVCGLIRVPVAPLRPVLLQAADEIAQRRARPA
jgi:hypothetical protein